MILSLIKKYFGNEKSLQFHDDHILVKRLFTYRTHAPSILNTIDYLH